MDMTRRSVLAMGALAALPCQVWAQEAALALFTAGQGSGFLPYGQGLAAFSPLRRAKGRGQGVVGLARQPAGGRGVAHEHRHGVPRLRA